MDEEEIDGVKSPIKRLGSTRKLLVFNSEFFLSFSQLYSIIDNTKRFFILFIHGFIRNSF